MLDKITKEHVGQRLLVVRSNSFRPERQSPLEVFVEEISPSEKFIKLKWPSEYSDWGKIDEYLIVEVLNRRDTLDEQKPKDNGGSIDDPSLIYKK